MAVPWSRLEHGCQEFGKVVVNGKNVSGVVSISITLSSCEIWGNIDFLLVDISPYLMLTCVIYPMVTCPYQAVKRCGMPRFGLRKQRDIVSTPIIIPVGILIHY